MKAFCTICLLFSLCLFLTTACKNVSNPGSGGEVPVVNDIINWDFEDWSVTDPPAGWEKSSNTGFSVLQEYTLVSNGLHSASIDWTTTVNRDLQMTSLFNLSSGQQYTFHAWVYDEDSAGAARICLRQEDDLGGYVDALYSSDYSGESASWNAGEFNQMSVTMAANPGAASITGRVRFYDRAAWDGDATVVLDDIDITQPLSLNMDGELDSWTETNPDSPAQLADTPIPLYAALTDAGNLYVASAPGDTVVDRMVFVWIGGSDSGAPADIPIPWNKVGTVPRPVSGGALLVLLDEGSNTYCEWQQYTGSNWQSLSGTDSSCTSGTVLEGYVDLINETNIPWSEFYLLPAITEIVSVGITTDDAGSIVTDQQTPPFILSDSSIQADEAQSGAVHRADLLVGRIK